MPRLRVPSLTVPLLLTVAGSTLHAQSDTDPAAEAPEPRRAVAYELSLEPSLSTAGDFDDAGGDLSVVRVGAQFGVRLPVGERNTLGLRVANEHSWYDFSGPVALVPGTDDPFEHVSILQLGVTFTSRVNDRWSWIAGASIESAAEDGADFSDSLTYAGSAGVQHEVADGLRVGVLLSVSSRLEDDVRVLPLPLIEWQIDERWRLGPWPLAGRAGAYALTYSPSEAWTLGVAAGYQAREFRLDDGGPVPDGVGRDRRLPVAVVGQWTPRPSVLVRGFAGADVYSEIEVLDASGDTIGEDRSDTPFTFGVSATLRF